jgi:adenine phosphoribosyltransferase
MINIRDNILTVKDWPKKGVDFLDLNRVFNTPHVLDHCCTEMSRYVKAHRATSIVAVESRGFVMGAILARTHGFPLVLARKKGKLPGAVYSADYDTEYSSDTIEIQQSAQIGDRPFIVDDVIATGGTVLAVASILREQFAVDHLAAGVIANLDFLPGRRRVTEQGIALVSLVDYE